MSRAEQPLTPKLELQIHKVLARIDAAYDRHIGRNPAEDGNRPLLERERIDPALRPAVYKRRREAIKAALLQDPEVSTTELINLTHASESVVTEVRRELGIPAPGWAKARKLKLAYQELIAQYGQITDAEAARRLNADRQAIKSLRLRLEGKKR